MKLKLHAVGVSVMILSMLTIAAAQAAETHTVSKGDTLYSIAKKHKTTVRAIEKANDLDSKKPLKIGIKLDIPSKDSTNIDSKDEQERAERLEKRFGPRVAKQINQKDGAGDKPSVVRTALTYRGTRYVRGGTSSRGFDCSGFTRHVYLKHGISLPHSSRAQASCGKSVNKSELKSGDLVFFQTRGRGISHVGLYIGENKFIHAATTGRGVVVNSLNESYYAPRYRGARRIKG